MHAAKVAPDVITSSTNRTSRPRIKPCRFGWAMIAFSSVSARSVAVLPSRTGVFRRRSKRSGQTSSPASFPRCCARRADWLYRRFNNRVQCRGTGAISIPSRNISCPARAIHCAAGRANSGLSPCFNPRIRDRALPSYNNAARPSRQGRGVFMQSSHSIRCPSAAPGNGTPQLSHTTPPIKGVSRQHDPQRPKSASVRSPHPRQRGG